MLGTLVQIDGFDPVGGVSVTLRASSLDDDRVCHLNGQTWWPALVGLPKFAYDLFDGGFGGKIDTPSTSLGLMTERWPDLPRYSLGDARVRLWTGEAGAAWGSWTLRFDGRVTAQPKIADALATLSIAVDDRWLDAPLLGTYAGTGGVEGPAALKGAIKPLALGAPRYLGGVLIDPTNNVFQLSAYGAIEAVESAFDELALFGPASGDFADLSALLAATIAPGSWATCRAAGLVRHGAPPYGKTSYHARGDRAGPNGWIRKPGQLIRRLALLSGGAGRVHDASLNALDLSRPYNLSVGLSEQTTARDAIQRIAASINAVAGVSWLGQLFVIPVAIGTPSITLRSDGTALPPVMSVTQEEAAAPWWKLAIQADRTWEVHASADVAYTEPPEPGATLGAPEGTLVAGRPAEVLIDDLDRVVADLTQIIPSVFDLAKSLITANAIMQAKTTLDGKAIGTVVVDVQTVTESMVEEVHLIGAKNGPGTAFNMRLDTVYVGDGVTLGQRFEQLEAYTDDGLMALNSSLAQAIVDGDGALSQQLDTVQASLGGPDGLTAQVSFLRSAVVSTGGDTVAKAVLSVNAAGRVSGLIATNDGSTSSLDLDFDAFRLFRPDGTLLIQTKLGDDRVYIPNAVVDTLEVNTAVVPVRTANTSPVAGTHTDPQSTPTAAAVLSVPIVMPVPGWIEAQAFGQQGYAGSSPGDAFPYAATISVNGGQIPEAVAGGSSRDNNYSLGGFFYAASPGTYTVTLNWNGITNITLNQRVLFVKGFPFTE